VLTTDDIETQVTAQVHELLLELDEDDVPAIEPTSTFADLGMDSLTLARLIIELEDAFGVEPFRSEEASVADVRTVGDLVGVYREAVGRLAPAQA